MIDERTRASMVVEAEQSGHRVADAPSYVKGGMDTKYVSENPSASRDWALELLREAREGHNPLSTEESKTLRAALASGRLPEQVVSERQW